VCFCIRRQGGGFGVPYCRVDGWDGVLEFVIWTTGAKRMKKVPPSQWGKDHGAGERWLGGSCKWVDGGIKSKRATKEKWGKLDNAVGNITL